MIELGLSQVFALILMASTLLAFFWVLHRSDKDSAAAEDDDALLWLMLMEDLEGEGSS